MKTRIRGRYVVGCDPHRRSHVLIKGGSVVFEDDRIDRVGADEYEDAVGREIDARHGLVMPGLIDTHALMDVGIHLLLSDRERDPGYRSQSFVYGDEDVFGRNPRAGVNVRIGTDTHPNDMLREMQDAAVMGKVAESGPTATTAADVFDAATLHAASFLGRNDLGRPSPGARADIVLANAVRLTFAPTLDPVRSLVYHSGLRNVETVVIDGDAVVEGGAVAGVDEADLTTATEEILHRVGRTFQAWDHRERPYRERFGPSFPWVGRA